MLRRPVNSDVMRFLFALTNRIFNNGGGLAFLLLLGVVLSCTHADLERATTVTIADENFPPTFKLGGNGDQIFFIVTEVAPENLGNNPYAKENTPLWQIWHKDERAFEVWLWPALKYGTVPDGFIQKIPANGPPPSFVEGKIYEAGGPAMNAPGGYIRFAIHSGKIGRVRAPWENY